MEHLLDCSWSRLVHRERDHLVDSDRFVVSIRNLRSQRECIECRKVRWLAQWWFWRFSLKLLFLSLEAYVFIKFSLCSPFPILYSSVSLKWNYQFNGFQEVLHLLVLLTGDCAVDSVEVEVFRLLLLLFVFLELLKGFLPKTFVMQTLQTGM